MQAVRDGKSPVFEWVVRDAEGVDVPVEVMLVAFPAKYGHLVRVSAVDITQRKQAEATIAEQRMKMVASSRLSSLGAMASGIAHEISNPLSTISLGLEHLEGVLLRDAGQESHLRRVLNRIVRNVMRIERIIRGLTNLSREGARDAARLVPVKRMVQDTLELCQTRFGLHRIAIEVCEIPDDLILECRPTELSQLLLNLLNNAHDAVLEEEEKWVRVDAEDRGDQVWLAVTDSGRGIPEEQHQTVFEPFYSTKDSAHGTGLGLSISRRIAARHHGTLALDADCPHTRFVVMLPKRGPARSTEHLEEIHDA